MRALMDASAIPGASLAVLRRGKVDELIALGTRDAATGEPVTAQTVFQVASLTKPMAAYAA
eukprot:gene27178-48705_t